MTRSGQRVGRRHMPYLAIGRKRIGRRADRRAFGQFIGARPGLRAVRGRPDREISVKAKLKTANFGARGGAGQLPVGEPLGEQSEGDALTVLARLFVERRRIGAAQFVRPAAPIARRLLPNRLEDGKAPQSLAALADKGRILGK